MNKFDKGWHEVNWTTDYADKAYKILMTIICVSVIARYFWEVLS